MVSATVRIFFFVGFRWRPGEIYRAGLFTNCIDEFLVILCGRYIPETAFIGHGDMVLADAVEVDMRIVGRFRFMMVFVEIFLYEVGDGLGLVHAGDKHLVAHPVERDVADIEELVEYASLMRLDAGDVMEFREARVLHEERPADVDDAPVGDDPDIAVPVQDLVEHDEKKHKDIRFKQPQK